MPPETIDPTDYIGLAHHVLQYYLQPDNPLYDDALGEAYVGLCYAAENYDPTNPARFSTYAYSCIRGYVLNFLRGENKYREHYLLTPEVPESPTSIQEDICFPSRLEELRSLLTPTEARVIIMSYGLDNDEPMNPKDIAEALDCNSGTVRQSKYSALKKLRKRPDLFYF